MKNIAKEEWEEYQSYAARCWHSCNDILLEWNQETLDDLLSSSKSVNVSNFSIDTRLIFGIDLDIIFNADGKKSQLWVAESVNYVPNIIYFLEAIISTDDNEYFYYCEEEGPDTYLYVKKVTKDDIRFVHISERAQFAEYIKTEEFKIRQDIVINKNQFIKDFYTSITKAVKNTDIKYIQREWWYQTADFEELQEGSPIIENYLKDFG